MALAAASGCAALISCSAPVKHSSGPWASDIAKSASQASSKFEQQVFADGKISRAEYEEAVHRNIACLDSRHLAVTAVAQPDGTYGYSFSGQMTPTMDRAMNECGHGTVQLIEPLYKGIVQNPKHVNPVNAMAACMVKKHRAPTGFTGQELQALLTKYQDPAKFPVTAPVNGKDPAVSACLLPPYS